MLLATTQFPFEYEVSVVVFYKRVIDNLGFDGGFSGERLVDAKIVSTGLNGGQVLLEPVG